MAVKDRDWMRDGALEPELASPVMSMLDSAVAMHEMYRSYLKAGFTDAQAMQLLVGLLQKHV